MTAVNCVLCDKELVGRPVDGGFKVHAHRDMNTFAWQRCPGSDRIDHPSAAPPPIAVLGDETGPGGTGPVDQRPRNLTRGGRP